MTTPKATEERLTSEADFHDNIAGRIKITPELIASKESIDCTEQWVKNLCVRLTEDTVKAVGDVTGKKVLVLGAGTDDAAIYFAKNGAQTTAIDISPKSVEITDAIASELGLEIRALVMDAHDLQFAPSTFDMVYGNAIMHHLDSEIAIRTIHKVLKPGGRAIFREVNSGGPFVWVFRAMTPNARTPDEHPLNGKDLGIYRKAFGNMDVKNYVFSSVPYVGLLKVMQIVTGKRFRRNRFLMSMFDKLDRFMLRLIPFLNRGCWLSLIQLSKSADDSDLADDVS